MPILDPAPKLTSSQRTLSAGKYYRPKHAATRVSDKGSRNLENLRTRPEKVRGIKRR